MKVYPILSDFQMLRSVRVSSCIVRRSMSGEIRGSGDAFGKKEKAVEDQYFRKKERDQVKHLKEHPEELKPTKEQESKSTPQQSVPKKK